MLPHRVLIGTSPHLARSRLFALVLACLASSRHREKLGLLPDGLLPIGSGRSSRSFRIANTRNVKGLP